MRISDWCSCVFSSDLRPCRASSQSYSSARWRWLPRASGRTLRSDRCRTCLNVAFKRYSTMLRTSYGKSAPADNRSPWTYTWTGAADRRFSGPRRARPGQPSRNSHMRTKAIVAPLFAAALALGACSTDAGQKQTGGTLLGGVGGALLGSPVGSGPGQLVAVALGTQIGSASRRERVCKYV